MKQAVRENRRGKVRVPEYLILDDSPEVALLRSRMEVCEEAHDCYTRWIWFIGYAPEFEPLVVGERPPEYEAIFTRHNGGPGVELMSQASPRPRPARFTDTVAAMERRGSITSGMADAARQFHATFSLAQLDPLKAFDISRPRTPRGEGGFKYFGGTPGARIEAARTAVWNATLAIGGLGSPGGSVLWHVVGWQTSLKGWALEQGWGGRHVSQEAASGILIAALGTLEAHYQAPRQG